MVLLIDLAAIDIILPVAEMIIYATNKLNPLVYLVLQVWMLGMWIILIALGMTGFFGLRLVRLSGSASVVGSVGWIPIVLVLPL